MFAVIILSYIYVTEKIDPLKELTIDLINKSQRMVLLNGIKNNFSIKYGDDPKLLVAVDQKEENDRIIITNKTVNITNLDTNSAKNLSYWLLEENQCTLNAYLLTNSNSATKMEFGNSEYCIFMDSYKSSLISYASSSVLLPKHCHIFEGNEDLGSKNKIEVTKPILITNTQTGIGGAHFLFSIFTLDNTQKTKNCAFLNFTFIGGNQSNVAIPKTESTSIYSRNLPLVWIIIGTIVMFSILYMLMIKTGFFNLKEYFLIGRDDLIASIPTREEEDLLEPIVEHDQDVPL